MTTINDFLIDDLLNLIMNMSNNYYCMIVCKHWYKIILPHSDICTICNKTIQVYGRIIWVTDPSTEVCHDFHVKRFKILAQLM